jgi:hypothetical protein
MSAETKLETPRKVALTDSQWMLAALKMDCVCDVLDHRCINCQIADQLCTLERDLAAMTAERDRLRALLERTGPYLQHKDDCSGDLHDGVRQCECLCGLAALSMALTKEQT